MWLGRVGDDEAGIMARGGVVSVTRHKANWADWGLVTAISRICFLLGGFVATLVN